MKHWFPVICLCLACAAQSEAAYRNLTPEEARSSVRVHSRKAAPEGWSATLTREDGSVMKLENLGDRFGSVDLNRHETVRICLSIPGMAPGSRVDLEATHGGKIAGRHRKELQTRRNGETCFDYQIANLGPHPLIVRYRGRSMTLLFHAVAPAAESGEMKISERSSKP